MSPLTERLRDILVDHGDDMDIRNEAADELEKAKELICIARMCMNPDTNAEWFVKATAFLNDLQAHS